MSEVNRPFTAEQLAGVYRAIYERRDVRSQFLADPIPPSVLARLLKAAHHAPSVGFMQPWDFVLIESPAIRQQVLASFNQENAKAAANYQGERQQHYQSLKLQGILESPINLCITCDRSRGGPHVLGRNSVMEMDLFSSCLAVQNLWLAARAEGIGVGWVSILDPQQLATILQLPESVYPLAYLCLGYVSEFLEQPELASKGWRSRLPLTQLVHADTWGSAVTNEQLLEQLILNNSDK
ncbi:cob(II)yrinic acid a,c-diamide reductase [Thiopseudomonas alkaliphila]|nr:5,6-dimethylbenzimidazole synthase [Thiopseudomonas alkaliphila]AKX46642.1 cob(II)yrinic acid a,c-diamide reductase [Thiopseudomonas alkaliphila]AKX49746.1 cob(II)yrinic acid a,c-diamide reductase [Thiopseudomonas alkaliphila]MDM1715420.1 5,6-dimethylbenzimidazole synthase [Thiopseudomonas alkaliphila]